MARECSDGNCWYKKFAVFGVLFSLSFAIAAPLSMYSAGNDYPESPAESEESITDDSPDNDTVYHAGSSGTSTGERVGGRGLPGRRESTAEKQRKWAVRTFTLWYTAEGVTQSLDDISPRDLNNLLKKFYKEARRKDGCEFSKPGLNNIRNALDRYFKSKLNYTILKTSDFVEANKSFDEKVSQIELTAASPWRHSVSISPQDMQTLLVSGAVGGSTPLLLLRACWFNILLHFDVGDHLKQRKLSKQQFVIHVDGAGREHIKMVNCFPYDQSKLGMVGSVSSGTTMHSVPGHPLCPVALLKKYLSKLQPDFDALFQCPVQYTVDDNVPVWYEKQAVGVHALEGMMGCISKEAGLSRIYSNGCLRKSSSLVYLQCGFGINPSTLSVAQVPSNIPVETTSSSLSLASAAASFAQGSPHQRPRFSSATSTTLQSSLSCVSHDLSRGIHGYSVGHDHEQLSSPLSAQSSSSCPSESGVSNFESNNTQSPTFISSSRVKIGEHHSLTNVTQGGMPQVASAVSLSRLPHDLSSSGPSRTAVGVCMPTIKVEGGLNTTCDTIGVQPSFPAESLDLPSLTESLEAKRQHGPVQAVNDRWYVQGALNLQGKTYLHMEILGGRSFVDFEQYHRLPGQEESESTPTLSIHLHFRGQRLRSRPTACVSEPRLTEGFFLELHNSSTTDSSTLLAITDPIHLILSKTEPSGMTSLIGSHLFDWQKVLKEPSGQLLCNADIYGLGEEGKLLIGSLQTRLEILPHTSQTVPSHLLDNHISAVKSRVSERDRRFMGYARQWWKEYMSGHPSHSRQQVKLFAQDECGNSRPVVSYVNPIQTGWLLDTPRQAARFVSLLAHEEECSMFGGKVDRWSSLHAFLCRRKGSLEDHAVLLCSILLGFGLDSYVCLGTRDTGQPHSWVMTRRYDGQVSFWESLTGQRFDLTRDSSQVCPQYRTVGCVFSNTSFYANIQSNGLISQCNFDLSNATNWKSMNTDAIHAVCGSDIQPPLPIPPSLSPSTIDVSNASRTLEQEMKSMIEDYRKGLDLQTDWDNNLAHLLSPTLAAHEAEACSGLTQNMEELKEPVHSALGESCSLLSVTSSFSHLKASQAFNESHQIPEYQSLIGCNKDHMSLSIRVKVFPYPENACATWVVLAAKFPSNDGQISREWKVLHSQPLVS